ncbi:MAG: hypothetical protein J07HX64_02304 [halophilic archaeon J07HX64]|nr:MAG: hypothetical protein J07HX64_02304 [halophilic archaeon J07HX64]
MSTVGCIQSRSEIEQFPDDEKRGLSNQLTPEQFTVRALRTRATWPHGSGLNPSGYVGTGERQSIHLSIPVGPLGTTLCCGPVFGLHSVAAGV